MKSYFVGLLLVVCVGIINAGEALHKESRRVQRCLEDGQCSSSECCIVKPGSTGRCRPLIRKGKSCLTKELTSGKYKRACPCGAGLACKPRMTVHTEMGDIEKGLTCVENKTTGDVTGAPDEDGKDVTEVPDEDGKDVTEAPDEDGKDVTESPDEDGKDVTSGDDTEVTDREVSKPGDDDEAQITAEPETPDTEDEVKEDEE